MREDSLLNQMSVFSDSMRVVDSVVAQVPVTASDVYGAGSQLIVQTPEINSMVEGVSLTDNIIFKLVVVLIFIGYCAIIYYYRQQVVSLLKSSVSTLFEQKLILEQNHLFTLFMNAVIFVGILSFSVITLRYIDIVAGESVIMYVPSWLALLATPALFIMFILVHLYQLFLLKAIGNITLSGEFTYMLLYVRKMMFSLGIIFIAPTFLLLGMNTGPTETYIAYLLVLEILIWGGYLIFKTYKLFIEQSVSILHWILYLCGVEIFPITVFVLIALRNT